jgi:hypothetical protein
LAADLAMVLLASPGAVIATRAEPERELDGFQGPVHGAEQVRADRADVGLALQPGRRLSRRAAISQGVMAGRGAQIDYELVRESVRGSSAASISTSSVRVAWL